MKRIVAVIFSIFVALGGAFAQSQVSALPEDEVKVDLSVKEYTPENQHLDKDDNGKAMNTVLGCLEDFQKENKYYHYKYMEKDRERYYKDSRGMRWAEYSSHVKFSR